MPGYASAKPQELASRKCMPEKRIFKALWKVGYSESFTVLSGILFKNKTLNVNTEKSYCF